MASEKRLIDANALIFHLGEEPMVWNDSEDEIQERNDWRRFKACVEAQDTVDAVEVVHGRWEDEYGGKYANPRYRCSVCKERALYKFERDMLDNWKEVQALTPNCPYCAARLDGERKDNEEKVD